jgi:wyosine [tRNA(Phe)-imidazoG37] synthetase (radical SAM superfamily)
MSQAIENELENRPPTPASQQLAETAFGYPRNFLGNRFVYVVVSPRARGLSIGVNMNPDRRCNFDCIYCEVSRSQPMGDQKLEVEVMAEELLHTLRMAHERRLRELHPYRHLPDELLMPRHVALSGDGEPTLCPQFTEAVQAVAHVRALGQFPFFKIILITNASELDSPAVQGGLKFFTRQDEVWAKLDAGTQDYMDRVDRPLVPLKKVLDNILLLGRQRPVVIQSVFLLINNEEPPSEEIEQYARRLRELKDAGAEISLVQIHSAARPIIHPECSHLPLKYLSKIAQIVRRETGLKAEVF